MKTFSHILSTLCLGVLCLGALGACKDKAPKCPDMMVTEGCTARCSRVSKVEGDTLTVCARQLMVQAKSQNNILQSDIQQVQTRKLAAESCFEVKGGQWANPADRTKFENLCKSSKP